MDTFGERFKKLRFMKEFTQEQLVNDFNKKYHYNLGKSAISQYENNRRLPEVNVLIDFANYFGVSVDFLLCNDEPSNDTLEEEVKNYTITEECKTLELTDLINEYKETISQYNRITFEGKLASKKIINLIENCLQVGIELARKEQNS